MQARRLGIDVFQAAVERMVALYAGGHRIVVSFSRGKDSTCALNVCIIAARETGRLPVEAVLMDEEVMFPGLYEYAERVRQWPEVDLHWLIMRQPNINLFNRESPYYWAFDPLLDPAQYMRPIPPWGEPRTNFNIEYMTTPEFFPPAPRKTLYVVVGLRVQESMGRRYGLFSSKSYVTGANKLGVRLARPIYDWTDGDVWRAIQINRWDYTETYDVLNRLGRPQQRLRLAPPAMNANGIDCLALAMKAWPQWFDRVAKRLPGLRTAAMFGRRAVQPIRRLHETWEACFTRTCVLEAPAWIRDRATKARDIMLSAHAHHATTPLPEVESCYHCHGKNGSWRSLALVLYNGDPFSSRMTMLPYVEPEQFRRGSGYWSGKPTF
jgi:predicted phosphoadenosine phosphosulfate sulfurtransferase